MVENEVTAGTAVLVRDTMREATNEFTFRRTDGWRGEEAEHLFVGATEFHLKAVIFRVLGARYSTYKLHTNSS
jgi:hypothetical protein